MQKATTDTAQDAMISALITPASVALMGRAEREFAPATSGATRTFEFPWDSQLVNLAPYDLRAVTAVVVDTDVAPGVTLSTDEWRLFPQPNRDGAYQGLRVQPQTAAFGRVMWRNRQIQITGDWGFATVPSDVKEAAAFTVVHWMKVNAAVFQPPDDNPDGYAPPKRGIPPEAWDLICHYKRAVAA